MDLSYFLNDLSDQHNVFEYIYISNFNMYLTNALRRKQTTVNSEGERNHGKFHEIRLTTGFKVYFQLKTKQKIQIKSRPTSYFWNFIKIVDWRKLTFLCLFPKKKNNLNSWTTFDRTAFLFCVFSSHKLTTATEQIIAILLGCKIHVEI